MKFEKTEVWGFEHSIRGMRNPLESWNKSDSFYHSICRVSEKDCRGCNVSDNVCQYNESKYVIGTNDLKLMQSLIKAGSEHRKFMRQIMVSVDITAPLYWWKEFDTYKVGTVANSTSTMHKLASTPITMDCFELCDSFSDYGDVGLYDLENYHTVWVNLIKSLEYLRVKYNETKDKRYWKELIRLLPESWLQTRTVTMNYENIFNMVHQRKNHKLSEWSVSFIGWAKSLPYADELLFIQ